jgi:hypothetical protein
MMKRLMVCACVLVLSCGAAVDSTELIETADISSDLRAVLCDEDNPNKALDSDPGVVAASIPSPLVEYIRTQGWNCMHRGWHAQRRFNFILGPVEKKYVVDHGWYAIDPATGLLKDPKIPQAGAVGNGLEFLGMHRAMLSMLRAEFPKDSAVLAGWTTVPTVTNAEDPIPGNVRAFDSFYLGALSKLTSDLELKRFVSDDEFGAYVQTKNYPGRGQEYYFLNPDKGAGIHDYLHNRYNVSDLKNPAAAVRMSNFSRNIENRTFWKLHGWLDGRWTAYRKARGLNDATDMVYLSEMNHACDHMGRGPWKVTGNGSGTCGAPTGKGIYMHPVAP